MPFNKNDLQWNATVKAYPAIADRQAISGFVRDYEKVNDVGAPNYSHNIYTVPAGKIFVLELISAFAWQADPTNIAFALTVGAFEYVYYTAAYAGAFSVHQWVNPLQYDEDEKVTVVWTATLALTDVSATLFGYLIDKY